MELLLNLRLFGEGGEGGSGAAGESAAGGANENGNATPNSGLTHIEYGKAPERSEPEITVTTDTADAKAAEFERLIHGDYADLYKSNVEKAINQRFKAQKPLEEKAGRYDQLSPVLEKLASKYGISGTDPDAILKAIDEDDSYYEDEALEKGLTVEQLKEFKRMERENAKFREAAEAKEQQEHASQVYGMWMEQAKQAEAKYPGFSLENECNNPETGERFINLLKSGVDVSTAYSVIHMDELIGGAMSYTAQAVQAKTVNDIRARGMRPQENGAHSTAAAVIRKSDPSKWTKSDRKEVSRRVLAGERIEL